MHTLYLCTLAISQGTGNCLSMWITQLCGCTWSGTRRRSMHASDKPLKHTCTVQQRLSQRTGTYMPKHSNGEVAQANIHRGCCGQRPARTHKQSAAAAARLAAAGLAIPCWQLMAVLVGTLSRSCPGLSLRRAEHACMHALPSAHIHTCGYMYTCISGPRAPAICPTQDVSIQHEHQQVLHCMQAVEAVDPQLPEASTCCYTTLMMQPLLYTVKCMAGTKALQV